MSRRPDRNGRPARQARARRLSLEPLEGRELLTLFTVTSAADNGNDNSPIAGSLRAEIKLANANPVQGGNTISFAIPGSGVQTIALQASLPNITTTMVIDGTSQPGYATNGTPLIVLDGSTAGLGSNGLTVASGAQSVIRGLSIVGFAATASGSGGEGILLEGSNGQVKLQGNYIGLEPDGTTIKANASGVAVFSPNNTIGGTTGADRNVISGNTNAGILLASSTATGNVLEGNFLGLDATGTVAKGNQYGVVLMSAPGNTIGGTVSGSGNVISGNVGVAGQTGAGILLEGVSTGTLIADNKIGTNVTGTAAVLATNSFPSITYSNTYGIFFGTPGTMGTSSDSLAQETVGGSVAGAGNLISGNFVGITGNGFATVASSSIGGNTIGLNLAGTAAIPNGDGVILLASLTTIGGTTPFARNVISGNSATISPTVSTGTGLRLQGDSDLVEGNNIGLTYSGLASALTGNALGLVLNLTNSTIGSRTIGNGNLISGNSSDGITLQGNGTVGIFGNLIGVDIMGNTDANLGNGITLTVAAPSPAITGALILNDTIGGTASGSGNIIAHNGGAGIIVHDNSPTGISGLGIRGNTIFANAKLGIDTQATGVPVASTLFINGYSVANGLVTVTGVYSGTPLSTVSLDLFGNANDPSGYGQGPVYLGTVSVTTNASGFGVFAPSFVSPAGGYSAFSATSTGSDGNTSEFSANFPSVASAAVANLVVQATSTTGPLVVGNTVTLTETVYNLGPNPSTGAVLYDSLPTSLIIQSVSASTGTASFDGNNVLTANLGTLAANSFTTVTIVAIASTAGSFLDQPGAAGTTFDPNYLDNTAQQTITVAPGSTGLTADLGILQSVTPTTALIGSPITYTITVGNIGPNISTNTTVFDTLTPGVTIVGVTSSQGNPPSITGSAITLNLGTLAPGATATVTIVVTPNASGSLTNMANVAGNQFDTNTANNYTSLTTPVIAATPSIHFYLAQTAFPAVGAIGQYQAFTMTVENFGPNIATNVFLIDNLPAGVTFFSAKSSQGTLPTLSAGVLKANFGTLAAGGIAVLQLIVVPNAIGLITNVAGVYTPDVPSAAPSFANASVSIVAGPSVTALNGFGNNSQLVLTFNEALNPTTALNPANYQLVSLGKTGTGTAKTIKIASITYNAVSHSVMIVPSQAIDPTQYYKIVVIGSTSSGVADTLGHRLASTLYGAAGSNFAATFFAGSLPQI